MLTAEEMGTKEIDLQMVMIGNEEYYCISNHDQMAPFFMSIVSDSNHWMFISSNGGLTAGRKNADFSLFPYYTDDKLTELAETTGSKSIFWVTKGGESHLWEPFSIRGEGKYNYQRNLYKNGLGNKLIFEEINQDLGVIFRYQWNSSNLFGFVRNSHLVNIGETPATINLLDGIQNILPQGVKSDLQTRVSNLVDAYKRSELDASCGLGMYGLSAIIVDRAEPSEALKCNIAWSLGLENPTYLVSSQQLNAFRKTGKVQQETDIKADKGAYFLNKEIDLTPQQERVWSIVSNVNQEPSDVAEMAQRLKAGGDLQEEIFADVALGSQRLRNLVSGSDGMQLGAHPNRNARHYSNTLFNIMRGGIFDAGYTIEKWDFVKHIRTMNQPLYARIKEELDQLGDTFTYQELKTKALGHSDQDFTRLAIEYLPLKFSRRHGDPSRPWNRFSINTRSEVDGSKILDYEGNWRDIFQNWEALAHAYPEYIEGMILKFLNASTFDGYNPYRVTKDGFDWETIEPHDPWSYIGYWGDHQIIYLLKFLEFIEDYYPGQLVSYCSRNAFVYANVPYKIKSYQDTLANPKDTIEFDEELDQAIRKSRAQIGSDGALIKGADKDIYRVNFIEKILATLLSKLSNFIPEGGIWMNTQRPEWNDANNALVGNGVSMVARGYLRRFCGFFSEVLANENGEVPVSEELATFYKEVSQALEENKELLTGPISDTDRKKVMDALGQAGSNYRHQIYEQGFSGKTANVSIAGLKTFCDAANLHLDHSLAANERTDGMYHAYNLMSVVGEDAVSISYLSEMLEGQVAVLSSGYLSSEQALKVLDGLKGSALFREDQYSYVLYPNKNLPGFLAKNVVSEQQVQSSGLLQQLLAEGNTRIIEKDVNGRYHFNGNFNNADSLKVAIEELTEAYADAIAADQGQAFKVFEEVFNHKAFTGRSGTFYGYEGLGSIYWHMVSKLLLAVEEVCLKAVEENQSPEIVGRLLEHFYEINEGIGVNKSPELYGAFPIDPYSHTPYSKGAQQPGMTGQVKEDILARRGEIGSFVKAGALTFQPSLLRKDEFLTEEQTFRFADVYQQQQEVELPAGTLAFTYCQVPVVYQIAAQESLVVHYTNGEKTTQDSLTLSKTDSEKVFQRNGEVSSVWVSMKEDSLR